MKIALGQINTTVGDFEGNLTKIISYTRQAQTKGADLVLFPELAICGYPPRDLVNDPAFQQRNTEALQQLVEQLPEGIAVVVGAVTMGTKTTPMNKPYNTAVFIRNQRVEFMQSKRLLPTYDVFDESRNFMASDSQQVITFKGTRIGITVCEDVWNSGKFWHDHKQVTPYLVDPVTDLVRQGAEIILSINASPWHEGKISTRHELIKDIVRDHEVPVVYVNSIGGNDHLIFDGSSFAVSSHGMVVAQAKSFEEDLIFFDTEAQNGEFHDYGKSDPYGEIFSALTLGTRDYVRKCGFEKVVIGLSGGIDSAVVAAIAVAALGKDNVTGITMPSKYSSEGSVSDSQQLADNLEIKLWQMPIQSTKELYQSAFSLATAQKDKGIPMTGLADENLQARIRGTILMTYSNQTGALVLSTGNKSEIAVGYCTLYGDMCGGLSVISDLYKTKVYGLAKWLNSHKGHGETIPEATITKPPSAELAPGQKDSDSLPPYEDLDLILWAYVEANWSAEHIASSYELDLDTVKKVIRMIDRNEYKRQQAAPGLKVSPKAFGIGRRLPIARKF